MADEEKKVDQESSNVDSSKKKKWNVLINVASITLIVVTLTLIGMSAYQIYHRNRYEHFWVNGQSMYPTLNKDAKYKDGSLIGLRNRSSDVSGNYDVDFGYMDTHAESLDNIKRFNIVVCQYNASGVDVIKRVAVLPGETFYITVSTIGSEENGNLYIKDKETGEFNLVEQPIDSEIVHGGTYTTNFATPTTLADNEYFVMGDNRYGSNSSDCRTPSNKVYRSYISGLVIGLEAKCRIIRNDKGVFEPTDITHYFPWRKL